MSTSLHKSLCFFFNNDEEKLVFDKDKGSLFFDDDVDLSPEDFMKKFKACMNAENLQKPEIEDIDFTMFSSFANKLENKYMSGYVFREYMFDTKVGISLQTSWDDSISRFKHNVDWYTLVDDMEFIQELTIGSFHCGKPCMKKVDENGVIEIVYENELIDAFLKSKNFSVDNHDSCLSGEKRKVIASLVNRKEMYEAMTTLGYEKYVNPAYYLFAKAGGLLKDDVTRKVFEETGNLSVISIWR